MRVLIIGFEPSDATSQHIQDVREKLRDVALQTLKPMYSDIDVTTYVQKGGLNVLTLNIVKMQVEMLKPDTILLFTNDSRASCVSVVEDRNTSAGQVAKVVRIVPQRIAFALKRKGITCDISSEGKKYDTWITLSFLHRHLCAHGGLIGWIRLPAPSSSSSLSDSTTAVTAALSGLVDFTKERAGARMKNIWAKNDSVYSETKSDVEKDKIANFSIKEFIPRYITITSKKLSAAVLSGSTHKVERKNKDFQDQTSTTKTDSSNDTTTVVSECSTKDDEEVSLIGSDDGGIDEDTTFGLKVMSCSKTLPPPAPVVATRNTDDTVVTENDTVGEEASWVESEDSVVDSNSDSSLEQHPPATKAPPPTVVTASVKEHHGRKKNQPFCSCRSCSRKTVSESTFLPPPKTVTASASVVPLSLPSAKSIIRFSNSILRRRSSSTKQQIKELFTKVGKPQRRNVTFSNTLVQTRNIPFTQPETITDLFYSDEDVAEFQIELQNEIYLKQRGYLIDDDDDDDDFEQQQTLSTAREIAV